MVKQQEQNAARSRRATSRSMSAVLALGIIAALVLLGMSQLRPPTVVPASAPFTQFSAERALRHVQAIAQRPHPVGSAEHDKVRDYLVTELQSLGLQPEVQRAPIVIALG